MFREQRTSLTGGTKKMYYVSAYDSVVCHLSRENFVHLFLVFFRPIFRNKRGKRQTAKNGCKCRCSGEHIKNKRAKFSKFVKKPHDND